jgi:acyl-[acyl carrier protein]--UDP-N-acetylglucosamine O-acyltransferase
VHWWCTGGALVMYWWCIGGALVVHWSCIGGALVVHWWCTVGAHDVVKGMHEVAVPDAASGSG